MIAIKKRRDPLFILNTFSGQEIDLSDPDPAAIRIEDIAIALSRIPRWLGHTPLCALPYSVAQHSIHVSKMCEVNGPTAALIGLMHDAHEAYLGDLTRPLIHLIGASRVMVIKHTVDLAISEAFGIDLMSCSEIVGRADDLALQIERMAFATQSINVIEKELGKVQTSNESYRSFIDRFNLLSAEISKQSKKENYDE